MLSIFKKKQFLVDLLPGITDIHNHILPGIDDGAANLDDSLNLISQYKEFGITDFIGTPHIMNDFYPNTPETIEGSMAILINGLKGNENLKNIRVFFAAEYMMDQNFLELMDNGPLLTLKDKFVLVEMSYFQPPINLNEILFQLQTQGYKPVLAHPERYTYCHSKDLKMYKDLKNRGCYFQLNALSLSNYYGKNMNLTAHALLEKGMIDFIGTDTHRLQHLEKLAGISINKKQTLHINKVVENTKEIFGY